MTDTVVTGLQAIQDMLNKQNENSGGDRPKANWLKVNDGQTVKIWFLQEADPGAERYNEKAGTLIFVMEHTNPENWRRKAKCTGDEDGQCYGCEQNNKGVKGWRAKPRLYVNVLVEESPGAEKYVAVMSQGMGDNAITDALIEFARENKGITQMPFKLKRKGEKKDTKWTLAPVIGDDGVDPDDYELFDLEETVVFKVPYEKQENFYAGNSTSESAPKSESASHDQVW